MGEDFEALASMLSKPRTQYIIDRYLKQVRLPKYRVKATKQQELKDFKKILDLGYIDSGDLAKYYKIVNGKTPTKLNSDFETLVYTHQIKTLAPPKKKAKPQQIIEDAGVDFSNKKERDTFFDELERKEGKRKSISKNLSKQGFSSKEQSSDGTKQLQKIKKELKSELKSLNKRILKDSDYEQEESADNRPMWIREMDAKNYKNPKKETFNVRIPLGKTKSDMEKLEKELENIDIGGRTKAKDIEELVSRIRKINLEEIDKKEKKKIKYIKDPKRKRGNEDSSTESSARSSVRSSVSSIKSDNSNKSISGYSES